jgi:hypothetical protein
VQYELRLEFEISELSSEKPVLCADDLLLSLQCHWAVSQDWFQTERQRIQLALLLLLIAYTAARPSTILEARHNVPEEHAGPQHDKDFLVSLNDADAVPDSLKYKDIALYKMRDHGDGEELFVMIITLRLMKGLRHKGVP